MLCLGPKKSLTSPRLEFTAQGVAYRYSKLSVKTTRLSRRPSTLSTVLKAELKKTKIKKKRPVWHILRHNERISKKKENLTHGALNLKKM